MRYVKIFGHFDQAGQGFLSSTQMREVMDQTKVDRASCDHVWSLVNPRGAERFDRQMFSMAMHFLYNKKKQIELPPVVPEETLISIDSEGYFKMKTSMQQRGVPSSPQP